MQFYKKLTVTSMLIMGIHKVEAVLTENPLDSLKMDTLVVILK